MDGIWRIYGSPEIACKAVCVREHVSPYLGLGKEEWSISFIRAPKPLFESFWRKMYCPFGPYLVLFQNSGTGLTIGNSLQGSSCLQPIPWTWGTFQELARFQSQPRGQPKGLVAQPNGLLPGGQFWLKVAPLAVNKRDYQVSPLFPFYCKWPLRDWVWRKQHQGLHL